MSSTGDGRRFWKRLAALTSAEHGVSLQNIQQAIYVLCSCAAARGGRSGAGRMGEIGRCNLGDCSI